MLTTQEEKPVKPIQPVKMKYMLFWKTNEGVINNFHHFEFAAQNYVEAEATAKDFLNKYRTRYNKVEGYLVVDIGTWIQAL